MDIGLSEVFVFKLFWIEVVILIVLLLLIVIIFDIIKYCCLYYFLVDKVFFMDIFYF